MASTLEEERWNLYLRKYDQLFRYGVENNLIRLYEPELLERLKKYYFGGIPLSIVLMCNKACNGFCYDRALYVAICLENCEYRVVDADVDSLRLNPVYIDENLEYDNPHYANHCFVERKMDDGTWWVYDTSVGLVFERGLYYEMQNPVITCINSKERTQSMPDYQEIKGADIEQEKYALPLILPTYEALAKVGQPYYTKQLCEQLAEFKKEVNFDDICQEVEDDMKRMGLLKSHQKISS